MRGNFFDYLILILIILIIYYFRVAQFNQKSEFLPGHLDYGASRYIEEDMLFKNFQSINTTARPRPKVSPRPLKWVKKSCPRPPLWGV